MANDNSNLHLHPFNISKSEREQANGHLSPVFWIFGLSGSGKSSLSNLVQSSLLAQKYQTAILDGDHFRNGLSKDLGFSLEDRAEHLRRVAEVAKIMSDQGHITLCSFITPLKEYRELISRILGDQVYFIFLDCPIEECKKRDPKGLYAKAESGLLKNFTGIDSPFDSPGQNTFQLNTAKNSIEISFEKIIRFIREKTAL